MPPMTRIRHLIAITAAAIFGIAPPLQAAENQKPAKSVTSESFGKLAIGQSSVDVLKVLGKPGTKGKETVQEADGTRVQHWSYPDSGLTIVMQSLEKNGAQTVHMIRAVAPCTLATARGIKIGSAEAVVQKAYAKERNKARSNAGKSLLAGSPYDGVEFTFTAGKVGEIFVGVTAE